MDRSNQQGSPLGLIAVIALIWYLAQQGGTAPIRVPGITAIYFHESGDKSKQSREQRLLFAARGPSSLRAELESKAHKTDGTPDVRFLDIDDDLSRDINVASQARTRWEAAGKPPLWRYLGNDFMFFEGVPASTLDELAKLRSLE